MEIALIVAPVAMVLAAIFIATARYAARMPVKFKTLDEQSDIIAVAYWAQKTGNIDSKRLRYSITLDLATSAATGPITLKGSIPVEELAILAPWIDRVIDGKGPPRNLPPEYVDRRPVILGEFKKRMQDEGLWPRAET